WLGRRSTISVPSTLPGAQEERPGLGTGMWLFEPPAASGPERLVDSNGSSGAFERRACRCRAARRLLPIQGAPAPAPSGSATREMAGAASSAAVGATLRSPIGALARARRTMGLG